MHVKIGLWWISHTFITTALFCEDWRRVGLPRGLWRAPRLQVKTWMDSLSRHWASMKIKAERTKSPNDEWLAGLIAWPYWPQFIGRQQPFLDCLCFGLIVPFPICLTDRPKKQKQKKHTHKHKHIQAGQKSKNRSYHPTVCWNIQQPELLRL